MGEAVLVAVGGGAVRGMAVLPGGGVRLMASPSPRWGAGGAGGVKDGGLEAAAGGVKAGGMGCGRGGVKDGGLGAAAGGVKDGGMGCGRGGVKDGGLGGIALLGVPGSPFVSVSDSTSGVAAEKEVTEVPLDPFGA